MSGQLNIWEVKNKQEIGAATATPLYEAAVTDVGFVNSYQTAGRVLPLAKHYAPSTHLGVGTQLHIGPLTARHRNRLRPRESFSSSSCVVIFRLTQCEAVVNQIHLTHT